MKKRIFAMLALLALLVLGLGGCRKAPKAKHMVVSAPDQVIGSTFNPEGMQVYIILDTGQIAESKVYNTKVEKSTNEQAAAAGVHVVTIEDVNYHTTAKFKVIITPDGETSTLPEEENFLVIRYEVERNEKNQIISAPFSHQRGYTFDEEKARENVNITKVVDGGSGAAIESAVEEYNLIPQKIKTEETKITYNNLKFDEEKGQYEPLYKQEKYRVLIEADGITDKETGSYYVQVVGGLRPIHKKSFGWFDVIVLPISAIIRGFAFGGNFGVGILFATIIVRSLAWPIYAKTNDMSARMAEAQPELERIQNKYRGREDKESKQQMQLETMKVYKKYKIGMGSFLLPFIQMPIFIAMYQAVTRVIIPGGYFADHFTKMTFLGIDLTIGGHWTSYLLAVIVVFTMGLLQWISSRKPTYLKNTHKETAKVEDKAKKSNKTMYIISGIMMIMMFFFSIRNNALALYWVFGNLFSIGQTLIHKRLQKVKYLNKQEATLGGVLEADVPYSKLSREEKKEINRRRREREKANREQARQEKKRKREEKRKEREAKKAAKKAEKAQQSEVEVEKESSTTDNDTGGGKEE